MFSFVVLFLPCLYLALVFLGLAVVADGHKEYVAGVLRYLLRVLPLMYLVDGGAGGVIVFQFHDDGGCRRYGKKGRFY